VSEVKKDDVIPSWIVDDVLKRSCTIVSNPQFGKTNLAKVLISEIVRQRPLLTNIKVFDVAQVWRHSFLSSFKMQEINDNTVKVYAEPENTIFDIEYEDSEKIMQFMGNTVLLDYEENRLRKKMANGKLMDYKLYCIEEAQNSLGTYSLSRETYRIWLKMISEAGNFNMSFIFIGQRAADISTKAIERSQTYFIGKTVGDRNIMKLRGIIGRNAGMEQLQEPLYEKAKRLKLGEFLFWNGATAWLFECPKFEDLYPNEKPIEVKPEPSRWLKIW
jgi:hypothetical protein